MEKEAGKMGESASNEVQTLEGDFEPG